MGLRTLHNGVLGEPVVAITSWLPTVVVEIDRQPDVQPPDDTLVPVVALVLLVRLTIRPHGCRVARVVIRVEMAQRENNPARASSNDLTGGRFGYRHCGKHTR